MRRERSMKRGFFLKAMETHNNDEGNLAGGVELFRDITESKRLERERKNILSMFAHDMKNPVATSEGFLSLLLSGKGGPNCKSQPL